MGIKLFLKSRTVIVKINNMIDAKELFSECTGRWFSIYRHLGINVGTGAHQYCPICGDGGKGAMSDRFRIEKDGSGYYCNQCHDKHAGTGFTLIQKALSITFPETLEKIANILGGGYTRVDTTQTTNKMSINDVKKMLNDLWTSSKTLTGSDHACRYLHSRGLVLQPDNVRFCKECYESETKTRMPAMVARIVNKDNRPMALHRTYLQSDVFAKAEIKSAKKMTPTIDTLVGCSVRLFPPKDKEIIVCEGIETGIACNQIFDKGVHACLSSTIMEGYEPPSGIRKIIICGDSDANFTGQKSAYKLANRLHNKDFLVEVRFPEIFGDDFADELWRQMLENGINN